MKNLFFPLLAASSILSMLGPHAEAGVIAANSRVLSPRLFGPGTFGRARAGSVPTGAIRLAGASNEIAPTVLDTNLYGGTLSAGTVNVLGGTITANWWTNLSRTGAGTLTLDGNSGNNMVNGGGANLAVDQTLDSLVIDSNAVVTLNPLTPPSASGTLTLENTGFVNGGILTVGSGTLSNGTVNLVGGTITAGSWTNVGSGPIQISGNGSNVRVTGVNLFVSGETTPSDGLSGSLVKTGTGTLALEGRLGIHVVGGTSGFEAGQTLDSFVIDSGAIVVLDTISSPPVAPVAANAATSSVPEPASAILLVIGALAASRVGRRRLR